MALFVASAPATAHRRLTSLKQQGLVSVDESSRDLRVKLVVPTRKALGRHTRAFSDRLNRGDTYQTNKLHALWAHLIAEITLNRGVFPYEEDWWSVDGLVTRMSSAPLKQPFVVATPKDGFGSVQPTDREGRRPLEVAAAIRGNRTKSRK
ncbi:hypothetical protein LJR034_003057 [Caballeronia sp. LjRoot34]|uniref:hypothetical protein n=1 Tax=Caballeronia sp. LjRoot34 TaxID=3342325 RepID=UPI003ECD4573